MDIQNQKTSDGSIAIQAGGNITINDYSQIKEIFSDLYRLNFPALVHEATEKAQENLKIYIDTFVHNINEDEKAAVQDSLRKPKSQFLLNQSIQSAARFGGEIDLSLLSCAVKSALMAQDNLLENLFAHASEIIPRLTKLQLLYILTVFYIHDLGFREEAVNVPMIELTARQIFSSFTDFPISGVSYKMHLVSLGVFSFNQFNGDSASSLMARRYPQKYASEIKPAIDMGQMPFIKQLLSFYDSNFLVRFPITPIGSTIGFLVTREAIPMLDQNILLNL